MMSYFPCYRTILVGLKRAYTDAIAMDGMKLFHPTV